MSASADPMWFFYHEDALLTANNFDVPELQKAGLIGQTEDVHLILEYRPSSSSSRRMSTIGRSSSRASKRSGFSRPHAQMCTS